MVAEERGGEMTAREAGLLLDTWIYLYYLKQPPYAANARSVPARCFVVFKNNFHSALNINFIIAIARGVKAKRAAETKITKYIISYEI